MNRLAICCLLLLVVGCVDERVAMSQFKPGQVWTYPTRPGEEASRVTVLKVENDKKLGMVVHIHVSNVKIPSPTATSGETKEIGHMPFTEKALAASVLEQESTTDQLPDFQAGYDQWHESQGGTFSITVTEGVEFVCEAMKQQQANDG